MAPDSTTTADVSNPYHTGDPVVDCAQGRPMVVVDAPQQTVAEWSGDNGYDLLENYANSKFEPSPDESVVECVYVSDVRSEPSKTYTFPVSRVRLIDVHHADDGLRLAERVRVELLADLLVSATGAMEPDDTDIIRAVALDAGVDEETVGLAQELADVDATIGGDDHRLDGAEPATVPDDAERDPDGNAVIPEGQGDD